MIPCRKNRKRKAQPLVAIAQSPVSQRTQAMERPAPLSDRTRYLYETLDQR